MKKWYALYSNILYLHFSEKYYSLPESAKNASSPQNPINRLIRVGGYTIMRLIGNLFQSVEKPEKLEGNVWLYVVSQNNLDSLQFVRQNLPGSVFVAGQSKNIGRYQKEVERLSLRRKLLYYYKLPSLLYQFLRKKPKSAIRFFDLLYDAVGFYEVYYRKLQRYSPSAIIFANDHNADARAMLLAAKDLGIKTIYIQHASVSSLFPPLSYDLNLLEGQDSLDKYKQCGPIPGRVELVGMPKADKYIPYRNTSKHISTIGIGCNLMDDLGEIEKMLRLLSQKLPDIKLILRPHPRDTRNIAALARVAPNVYLSDSRSEPVFEYLRQLDVQISGTSGIHLEAVLLNVWSIYYDFSPSEKLNDYYGFVRHGLVDVAESAEGLIDNLRLHINSKPDVVGRAKYYSATLCTADEGHSGDISISHISSFLNS
ncbi:hypothetical protein GCM10023188_18030 [Pontibacter saemangeumensis]|uniref:CDP-Glycerol:Poly(Glycerophosphate) glycerophosphotransferase n=1 Tax=Pontibacter saemangeumensis TaxID=1084525 RepID=A0ABP8LJJ0_9BACT